MANSFETDGRGPSEHQLFASGVAIAVVIAVVSTVLMVKSTGRLNEYVRVVADLANVGDGLPDKSDVKFQEVLVGSVSNVEPAQRGGTNIVHINLKPEMAHRIPDTVTARVIPNNAFGVSSVELVDHGAGPAITDGARIQEETDLPTLLFQTTVNRLRDILAATGRGREDHTVGLLAAVSAATENRRVTLLNAAAQLTRLLDQLNGIVATDTGPSTLSALVDATNGLRSTAPELVDALHNAVRPMRTIAEKREQLQNLLSAGLHTMGTTRQAVDNHTDQLINITTKLSPALGVLAQNASQFLPIMTRLDSLSDKFFSELWDPASDTFTIRANVSFTPSYMYTRADCPQYGDLKGPSCYTAPQLVVRPDLPEVLLPQNYKPPADLAPPPGTVIGPDGNLQAVGPPLVNPNPNLTDPNPPLPWWQPNPSPRVPGTSDPEDKEPPPGAPGVAPASFGGNVGPVGSARERDQLSQIIGRPASPATQLLLGPVARGTNVTVTKADSMGAGR